MILYGCYDLTLINAQSQNIRVFSYNTGFCVRKGRQDQQFRFTSSIV